MEAVDYEMRHILKRELVDRCKRNPKYSLRAFAKQLGVDASTLSKIMSGQRKLGEKATLSFGTKLGLDSRELKRILKAKAASQDTTDKAREYRQIALDQFAVVSDWYHFAMLELLLIKDFSFERKSIARALGLSLAEVDAALERLQRIGLLERSEQGKWIDTSSGFTTNIDKDSMSSAHRALQQQLLEKAVKALSEVPISERDHTAITVAIKRDQLPMARQKIAQFRRALGEEFAAAGEPDDVYNLNICLFPLTNLNQRR